MLGWNGEDDGTLGERGREEGDGVKSSTVANVHAKEHINDQDKVGGEYNKGFTFMCLRPFLCMLLPSCHAGW
jgi:hypothetical protein